MKIFTTLIFAMFILSACNKISLTKEDAYKLIEQHKNYPQIQSYQIYTKDAEDGRRVLDVGLEKDGLVRVERHHKTGENQKAIIEFTDKASEFLLPPDKGQLNSVQKIKVAEEVLDSILSIQVNEKQKTAVVNYSSKYVHVNPFAKLDKKDYTQTKKHQANLTFTKDGWIVQ
ncbi:hypothetical protein RYH73_23220 [Olivibacter sp. CPCC 100613]|uniref:hypothetical protein n=1 Tax=Olivibacter sp. CPCC 100613 TaxID=3079931 RepID=UPI002FFC1E18